MLATSLSLSLSVSLKILTIAALCKGRSPTVCGGRIVADDCAATDAVCFSDTVDIKPCCVSTDICRHDDSDPVGTYKCQTDCTQSGGTCYEGTGSPKSCCDCAETCSVCDANGDCTCGGHCAAKDERCFTPGFGGAPPTIKSCCNPLAECTIVNNVGTCSA